MMKHTWIAIARNVTFFFIAAFSANVLADERITAEQREFFESRIRPVLVEHCYQCHNSAETAEADLALDFRDGLLKGGASGSAIVPGKPEDSLLLKVIRHEIDGQKMPEGGPKLDDRTVADFAAWIEAGAADPRDKPPTADELAQATSWEAVFARRMNWWSFQPIRRAALPPVRDPHWSSHPIDRFILAKLEAADLEPSEPADIHTLVRRLHFVLTGLPPTPQAIADFQKSAIENRQSAIESLVDRLLDSPHFGERWARHWMDWIRYAESHGSEGDPENVNAWHYRDYLIRALNADVPYDQLVKEHVAGDLLEQPRINTQLGIDESLIGPAHWRMVFHGFAPTDALDEKVRFTDDQINTFSKAFLGLTVSCARCHNHKFDPISQADYYALFGILGSCRPGRAAIDLPEKQDLNREQLAALKPKIRDAVAADWLAAVPQITERLLVDDALWSKADNPRFVLHPWFQMRREAIPSDQFAAAWERRVAEWKQDRGRRDEHRDASYRRNWDLADAAQHAQWFRTGNGLTENPQSAGEFALAAAGENAVVGVYPAGVYSHALSSKHAARLTSRDVLLDGDYDLYVHALGDGGATLRYVVQDYPRNGTVYPVTDLNGDWRWQRYDLTYWNGDEIHVELTTAADAPLLVKSNPRSWFGVREAVLVKKGQPAPPNETREHLDPLFDAPTSPPASFDELARGYAVALESAIKAWRDGKATDAQAMFLDGCLKQQLLPNKLNELPTAQPLVEQYRKLESEIPLTTRVPGLTETVGRDQRLFTRGNHKTPAEEVPRRFLEAIDRTPYETNQSGRLQLAEDLLRDDNPLTRRVIVNRLWHHLFGRGLVATPDNFGRLGQLPSHPELLDYLAMRFVDDGWSLKRMIRLIVTSQTWQQDSRPADKTNVADPENRLLSHANVRRLEAEAIRDSLLAVSGRLDRARHGSPVDSGAPRRSVYVQVRRNSLDPFLRVFDFPEPFSTTGRRDVTNVPAQSLTLMNDPRVVQYAADWATRMLAAQQDDDQRIRQMFVSAFGRPASDEEVSRTQAYLTDSRGSHERLTQQVAALRKQISAEEHSIRALTGPVRARLLAAAKANSDTTEPTVPQPIARWEFESDLKDVVGEAHGTSHGGARVEDGALLVDGLKAHVVTAPLKTTLKEKTLEAWVQLDNLDQRGGGVMTVQTRDGVVFDSIVFGEKDPRQWLAGSDFFRRTQSFNAPQEGAANQTVIHVAIAYHKDGRIVGYRDGRPYGQAYQSNGPVQFPAGETVVSFGVRHLPAAGNRMSAGRILRAQLYNRALLAEEIAATSTSSPHFVSEKQILAALTPTERDQVAKAKEQIAALQAEIDSLGPIPNELDELQRWTDLARAMFTFKEFIYVR